MLAASLLLALGVAGCATADINPTQPRANTGYVDFYADPATNSLPELSWDVARFEDRSQFFQRVFSEFAPPPEGFLRLAFAPGRHRFRITFRNCVIVRPVEIEAVVQAGKITPVRVTFTDAGITIVKTSERRVGGTGYGRYGRRTDIAADEEVRYSLSAVAAPPVAYQLKEWMPYAR